MVISGNVIVLMPWVASSHYGLLWFFRLIVGLAHGAIWAIMTEIMAHWTIPNERERKTRWFYECW
jgi:predicted MFS family arabinose efflux permease